MSKPAFIQAAKILSIVLIASFMSCGPDQQILNPIPSISFEGMDLQKTQDGRDSLIHIHLTYSDGDGDIGLGPEDSLPPFDRQSEFWQNLPVKMLHKQGNDFVELINPSTNEPFELPSERVPRITPEGRNKTITGTITVNLPANPLNTQPQEVKFELKLIDRNLNSSNVVTTQSVQLKH